MKLEKILMLIMNFKAEITETYGGYPRWATIVGGWCVLLVFAVLGYILWKMPGKNKSPRNDQPVVKFEELLCPFRPG